jgi:hypothetical protein
MMHGRAKTKWEGGKDTPEEGTAHTKAKEAGNLSCDCHMFCTASNGSLTLPLGREHCVFSSLSKEKTK